MKICDFCGTQEMHRTPIGLGDTVPAEVRRFRLELRDIDSLTAPDWAKAVSWWVLDLCVECRKNFVKAQDELVEPEIDFETLKIAGAVKESSLLEKLRSRGKISGLTVK